MVAIWGGLVVCSHVAGFALLVGHVPLTVVGGFAETLADDDLPPEQRRVFVETIRANAARMQRIVDDLLDLTRIESGGWVPKPEPTPVHSSCVHTPSSPHACANRFGSPSVHGNMNSPAKSAGCVIFSSWMSPGTSAT